MSPLEALGVVLVVAWGWRVHALLGEIISRLDLILAEIDDDEDPDGDEDDPDDGESEEAPDSVAHLKAV